MYRYKVDILPTDVCNYVPISHTNVHLQVVTPTHIVCHILYRCIQVLGMLSPYVLWYTMSQICMHILSIQYLAYAIFDNIHTYYVSHITRLGQAICILIVQGQVICIQANNCRYFCQYISLTNTFYIWDCFNFSHTHTLYICMYV